MYTSFRAQNFRLFKDLELTDLARINLIGGKNNVGKTSLLEALLAHAGNYEQLFARLKEVSDSKYLRYTTEEEIVDIDQIWNVLFRQFDTTSTIVLSGDGAHSQRLLPGFEDVVEVSLINADETDLEISITLPVRIRGELESASQLIKNYLVFKRTGSSPLYIGLWGKTFIRERREMSEIKSLFVNSRLSRERVDGNRLSQLKIMRQEDQLISALKIIEPALQGLDLLADGIYGDVEGFERLVPLESMGDGIRRLATIILAISAADNGVVAIDEIENGLHYSVLPDVWKAIYHAAEAFNVQVFATTHSYEMFQAAHQALSSEGQSAFRYYRLDRDPISTEIVAIKYDNELSEAAVEMQYEVRG